MRLAPILMLVVVMSGVAAAATIELKLANVEWSAIKIGQPPTTQPSVLKTVITKPTAIATSPATSILIQSVTAGADVDKMVMFKDDSKEGGASLAFSLPAGSKVDGVVRVRFTMVLPTAEGAGEMEFFAKGGGKVVGHMTMNVSTGQILLIPPDVGGKPAKKIKVGKLPKNKATVFEWYFDTNTYTQTLEIQGMDRQIAPTEKVKFDTFEVASGEEQLGRFALGKVEMGITPAEAPVPPKK